VGAKNPPFVDWQKGDFGVSGWWAGLYNKAILACFCVKTSNGQLF